MSKTTRELILDAVDAAGEEGTSLSGLRAKVDRNAGVIRQNVAKLVSEGVLREERVPSQHGETRKITRA